MVVRRPTWQFLRAPIEQAPALFVGMLVVGATLWFGTVNVTNAANLAPQWSQDLAFFHQWVHSAATGGPWASPLILEPQGFFNQVHTHFVLVPIVGLCKLWPEQNLLLVLHSFFAALTLWPTFRLAERLGGGRHAILCVIALLMFGPFQAAAVADFRPVILLLPSIVGVWYGAWKGSISAVLLWSLLGLGGRQEAAYLLLLSGIVLLFRRWGQSTREIGVALTVLGLMSWLLFYALKPEMFFHINPFAPGQGWPNSEELWSNRAAFGLSILLSGWLLGLLSPAPLLAALPIIWGFLSSSREWHALVGPGAHHHVLWLPFIIVAGVAGARRVPRNLGPLLLVCGSILTFTDPLEKMGNIQLQELIDQVPESAAVAADYDTIHRLSGRSVLWNVDHLYMKDRPWHWSKPWPITEAAVDWILLPKDHPVRTHLTTWETVDSRGQHTLLRRD